MSRTHQADQTARVQGEHSIAGEQDRRHRKRPEHGPLTPTQAASIRYDRVLAGGSVAHSAPQNGYAVALFPMLIWVGKVREEDPTGDPALRVEIVTKARSM